MNSSHVRTPELHVADPFLTIDQAAEYVGVPKATLFTWRSRRPGYGPCATKMGTRIRYRRSELDRWLDAHTEPAGDPSACSKSTQPSSPDDDHSRRDRSSQPEVRPRRARSRVGAASSAAAK